MRDYRVGIVFEEDGKTQKKSKNSLNVIEETIKTGLACRKEVIDYLFEIERTKQIKKRTQMQVSAQRKISDININAAREHYEYYVAELQEKLAAEEEKVKLEIQRVKLEVEERVQRERIEFDASMKRSSILKELLNNELKEIESHKSFQHVQLI